MIINVFETKEIIKHFGNWRKIGLVVTLLAICLVVILMAAPAGQLQAAPTAVSYRKVFAYEYTSGSSQYLTFANRSSSANSVTVKIYNPGGSLKMTKTVDLAANETVNIVPQTDWSLKANATSSDGNALVCDSSDNGTHGDNQVDCAYGIIATSTVPFEILTFSDEQTHGGSGASAVWTTDAANDGWWGMYNYPGGSEDKMDYFYLTNANDSSATVTLRGYNSAGTLLVTKTITLAAFETLRVYPNVTNSSRKGMGIASSNNQIGIYMNSTQGAAVSVYTQLGSGFGFPNSGYSTYDSVTGLYVPWQSSCLASKYIWTDAESSGASQVAARVTNPNNVQITVTQDFYAYDGSTYATTTDIPAFGTKELPIASGMKDESGSDPETHNRVLSAALPFHAHVSYFEQIDLPSVPKKEWYWGEHTSSNTDTVFLVNPDPTKTVTVNVQYWVDGGAAAKNGNSISLPPHQSLMLQLPSEGSGAGYGSGVLPSADSGKTDITYRFFSDDEFVLHLQMPVYGDLMAAECGAGTDDLLSDYGDAIDPGYPTTLASGARHIISATGPRLGACVDSDADGQPHIGAIGDDTDAVTTTFGTCTNLADDEDGVGFSTALKQGMTDAKVVINMQGSPKSCILNGWIDFDGSGAWGDSAGEKIISEQSVSAGSNHVFTFAVPIGATTGITSSRFRCSTVPGLFPEGLASDGEVEDYQVEILSEQSASFDFGDHVDSYGTLISSNGPRHAITDNLILGITRDPEPNGVPTANAGGDDTVDDSDDEDGVTPVGVWNDADNKGHLEFDIDGGDGCLNVWLDFTNDAGDTIMTYGDGDFDDTYTVGGSYPEHIIPNLAVIAGNDQVIDFPLPQATKGVDWAIRARLTPRDSGGGCQDAEAYGVPPSPQTVGPQAPAGTASPQGVANGGEIEDLKVSLTPTAVSLQDFGGTIPISLIILASVMALVLITAGAFLVRSKTNE